MVDDDNRHVGWAGMLYEESVDFFPLKLVPPARKG